MRLILRWLILAGAIYFTAWLLPGFQFNGDFLNLLLIALVFGLINAVIRPIIKLLTLPITILTLGLFSLVINALMLWLTAAIFPTLSLTGNLLQDFLTVFIASLIISIVSTILGWFLPD